MEAAEITSDCDGYAITANFLLNGRSIAIAAGMLDGVGHAEWKVRVFVRVFDENTYEEINSAGYIWSGSVTNPIPSPMYDEHIFGNEAASDSLTMATMVGHTYLISGAVDATASGWAGLAGTSGGGNNFWDYTGSSSIKLTSLSISKIYNLVISAGSEGTTNPSPGTHGYNEGDIASVQAIPYSDYSFSYWLLDGVSYTDNPISVTMNSHHTLSAHFTYVGGGGGGCPYVFLWDGQRYVMDNNILPAAEASNDTDVEDFYKLEQPLVPIFQGTSFSLYSMQIREFEHEHDHIDQVKLLAVDHPENSSVAVTPEGEIVTYSQPITPLSCVDNHGMGRSSEIREMDGNVSDPSTYFQGNEGDWLLLDFGRIMAENAKLILRDDQKCSEVCIEVQIPVGIGWQTIEVLHPRDYWSIEAVNLSAYVLEDSDFIIRLLWTAPHRLDYVGLETTIQESYTMREAILISAIKYGEGNVCPELRLNDQVYAELTPGEQIQLTFALPNKTNQERTFILYTEGHYNII